MNQINTNFKIAQTEKTEYTYINSSLVYNVYTLFA